jgi:hypothetical protein
VIKSEMRKGSVDCCRPLLSGKLAARDVIARSISTVRSHNRRRFVLETATLDWFRRDVEGDQEQGYVQESKLVQMPLDWGEYEH